RPGAARAAVVVAGAGRADAQRAAAPRRGRGGAGLAGGAARGVRLDSLLVGVALLEAVRRVAEVEATLKWPNDLLVGPADRPGKAAGILAEVAGDAVVVGIGLNVTTRAEELPATTGLPATSLKLAGAATTDRDPLL